MTTLQAIASLGANVEFGDVIGAFLEIAELQRDEGTWSLQQSRGGLQDLIDQQMLEVVLPLYGLSDSPMKSLLRFASELKQLGLKPSALD